MAPVAGAEPPVELPRSTDGNAAQVSANPQHNKPLGLQGAIVVRLLVAKLGQTNGGLGGYFGRRSVADEDGLAAPFDGDGLARGDGSNIKLGRGERQHIGGGAHGRDEFDHQHAGSGGVGEANPREEEVGEGSAFGLGDMINAVVGESVVDRAQFVEGRSLEGGGRR